MEEEKREISQQVSDIYKTAKGFGYNSKVMRSIIKIRKLDFDERTELTSLMGTYADALGMNIQLELPL